MVVRVGLTHTNYNSYLVGTIWCVLVFGNHSIWEVKVLISEIADCFLTPMGILAFRVDPTISVIQLFRLLRLRLNEPWVRHLSPCHLCFGDKKKAHFWGCTEVEKDHLGSKKKGHFCLPNSDSTYHPIFGQFCVFKTPPGFDFGRIWFLQQLRKFAL